MLRSDIRLSAEWYCLAAVKEANRISLRRSRNITFAKAKISRRTKWGISLSIPIAFAVGYFYVKKGGWEPQVYKSEVCGANERRAKLGPTRSHHVVTDFVSFVTAFLLKNPSLTHAVVPPFRNRSRLSRLFGCKRPHDGFVSLPSCFGWDCISEYDCLSDDYIVIVFSVLFALRRVLLLRSDIRLSAEWYCLAAVKEANRISLRRSRNITFAKAKISRRTKWGISLSIPIAFAVGYFYVKKGGWEPQVYKSEVCGANERRAKLGPTRSHHVVTDFVSFVTAFLLKNPSLTHAVVPPFRNRSRLSRLFGCKRPHDGFVSLPSCFGWDCISEYDCLSDDYIVIVFSVLFALRRVLLLRSDIRLSAEWYCLAAVKEANRISLRRSRNITFAKAKISRRTKWGISLKNSENAVACECEIISMV